MNIKDNSKKVSSGDIFVAIGKGVNYIEEAINNGASVIVSSREYNENTIVVEDPHAYLVDYLYENYYDYIKKIKLIGITGTNGKTTTSYLIYQALNKLNHKCAYIGTIGFYMNDIKRELKNTTPDILDVYEMLIECVDNNIEYVVMEASSQGLDMHRLDKLKFKYGIFTNLTNEHLDYHKTFENYALAKKKLFENCEKSIINIDDGYGQYFLNDNSITYSLDSDYKIGLDGVEFKYKNINYKSKLIGKHNIYNLLAVISLLKDLKLSSLVINELDPPIGRMDIIKYKTNLIIVDYAHTPDAVEKIITSVKELNPKNIITIIGCGGGRDKIKRPIMGSIATNNSDYVIFTNDNPRNENELEIINDILQNIDNNNYEIILNREKAIIKGIQKLEKNDILLVLGKGHENYQIIGNKKFDFDDKQVILKNI